MNKRTFLYLQKEKAIPCPVGSPMKDKNVLVMDGNNLSLKKVGEINVQEQIQTYLDGVALDKMIVRYQRGDLGALNHRTGFYGDVSGFSTDMREVIEQNRDVIDKFADVAAKSDEESAAEPAAEPTAEPTTEKE